MKNTYYLVVFSALALVSCKKEIPEVKKVDHTKMMNSANSKKLEVRVVNELDPICNMNTAEFLKDTAQYKCETYGFCSSYCKDEFLKSPEKYVAK